MRYHGVLAAHANARSDTIPRTAEQPDPEPQLVLFDSEPRALAPPWS